MNCPADVYQPSPRKLARTFFDDIDYSKYKYVARVSKCGCIRVNGSKKIFISDVFAGHEVGIKEADQDIWSINFMNYELGFFDFTDQKFSPAANPFLSITD